MFGVKDSVRGTGRRRSTGLILGLVGLIGDLAESLIKRDVGQKDSAPLLPGFGGLLDLLDSIIFTAPVAYVPWLILPLSE